MNVIGKTAASFALALALAVPSIVAAQHDATKDHAPDASAQPQQHKMGMMGQGGGMGMMGVPADKQEAVKKIQDEYKDRLFALRQDLHAKKAELEAVLTQAQPDEAKAKSVAGEVNAIQGKILDVNVEMRSRIIRETGVRTPIHGMDMMGGMDCKTMSGHGKTAAPAQDAAKPDAQHQQHVKPKK